MYTKLPYVYLMLVLLDVLPFWAFGFICEILNLSCWFPSHLIFWLVFYSLFAVLCYVPLIYVQRYFVYNKLITKLKFFSFYFRLQVNASKEQIMHLYRSKRPAYRAAFVLSYGMRCPDFELSEKENRHVVNVFAGETVGRDSQKF